MLLASNKIMVLSISWFSLRSGGTFLIPFTLWILVLTFQESLKRK